jgi:DnaJ-class molecular chaperone
VNSFFTRQQQKPRCNQPIRQVVKDIDITLDEAYFGIAKVVEIETKDECRECDASCNVCRGAGIVESVVTRNIGHTTVIQKCHKKCHVCEGSGKGYTKSDCTNCKNERYIKNCTKLKINRPERTFNDFTTKLKHPKISNCEIIFNVTLLFPDNFRKINNNLCYIKKISLIDALLGLTFEIKHPSGEIIKIDYENKKEIIQPDTRIILSNKGIVDGGTLVVQFDIDFPSTKLKYQNDDYKLQVNTFNSIFKELFS